MSEQQTVEVNFDGLIGPSHNYGGMSDGNLASASNAGDTSNPREAALQGLEKMRLLIKAGFVQGILPPLPRPNMDLSWFRRASKAAMRIFSRQRPPATQCS